MRVLVDAHTLIWAVDDPTKLSAAAANALQDPENELLLGAGTLWELSIKSALGRLTLSLPFRQWMGKAITDLGLSMRAISLDDADRQSGLPFHHRDPFDRLLAAQALVEAIPIVSADTAFDHYGVKRIWS
jgi:PIN domain nuclease of toxin-antitoxin system